MIFTTFTLGLLATSALAAPTYSDSWSDHDKSKSESYPYGTKVGEPKYFTSAFSTRANATQVIANNGTAVPGQTGAFGHFSFKINSDKDIICYDITLVNVTGEYLSPAFTATHIHQGPRGSAGPPRIAFPNPEKVRVDQTGAEVRVSKGCLQGPFSTNVTANGTDTGSASGFTLKAIEDSPSSFFADTHIVQFPAGAVRGQLNSSEVPVKNPEWFTSTLRTDATSNQVVNGSSISVPGSEGTKATYILKINSEEDILCYDIVVEGFPEGQEYFSPAKTATHVHSGVYGQSGPPRLAFKNPQPVEKDDWKLLKLVKSLLGKSKNYKTVRVSSECVKGPFTTGLLDVNGTDTGSATGFTLKQMEENTEAFNADFHTSGFVAGAVRGQLYRV
ncbi:hypothetical protein I302_102675 [Kwoniella bestiolae CBS 10118]|uniref:CHRD domain-containing protein n=1 Tax=Kwoniella bestiolae CBS 10118 TaxID=1296100 RepID=A0A1B9GFR3_9TREE|nr:hypothetical protein I302_01369 [Kwoniella bestiolae CBS 10118]OCF29856.1 hypothetical protein I302_01369 [Kwoniella bestiolae CBS 10118]